MKGVPSQGNGCRRTFEKGTSSVFMFVQRATRSGGCSVASVMSRLFAALWTVAHQAPLSMGFSRQEDWSGVPCPPPGDLPKAGIEPPPLTSPALAGSFFTTSTTWEAHGVLTLNAKYLLFYSWPQFILIIYNLKPIIIAIL